MPNQGHATTNKSWGCFTAMLTVGNSRWQPVLTSVKRATFSLISYASSGKSLPLTAGPKFRRWYA